MQIHGRNIAGVGFDLDGTLIHSEEINIRAVVATCRQFQIPYELKDKRELLGRTNTQIFIEITNRLGLGTAIDVRELSRHKREYFVGHLSEAQEVAGAVKFVRAVRRLGLATAIATAASNISLDAALGALLLSREEFSVLMPADSLPRDRAKPHPHHWAETARLAGVGALEFLVIEDTPRSAMSAVEAGCFTCGILTTHSREELLEAGTDFVVESFAELARLAGLDL